MTRMRCQQGSTVVEIALVLPLFLGLIGIILTIGWGLALRGLLHRGAEAGARAAAVIVDPDVRSPERYRSEEEIVEAVRNATILLGEGVDVTVTWLDPHEGEGARFAVTAAYTWSNPAAAFAAPLASGQATGSELTFTATASRSRE